MTMLNRDYVWLLMEAEKLLRQAEKLLPVESAGRESIGSALTNISDVMEENG